MQFNFKVSEGRDLGSIRIDHGAVAVTKIELFKMAIGLLSYAHRLDMMQYGTVHAKRDFGLKLTEVNFYQF